MTATDQSILEYIARTHNELQKDMGIEPGTPPVYSTCPDITSQALVSFFEMHRGFNPTTHYMYQMLLPKTPV